MQWKVLLPTRHSNIHLDILIGEKPDFNHLSLETTPFYIEAVNTYSMIFNTHWILQEWGCHVHWRKNIYCFVWNITKFYFWQLGHSCYLNYQYKPTVSVCICSYCIHGESYFKISNIKKNCHCLFEYWSTFS